MSKERTVGEDIRRFCRVNSVLDQIYEMSEKLQNLEDILLAEALEPILEDMYGENESPERIHYLLKIVDEEKEAEDVTRKYLDWLKQRLKDHLKYNLMVSDAVRPL